MLVFGEVASVTQLNTDYPYVAANQHYQTDLRDESVWQLHTGLVPEGDVARGTNTVEVHGKRACWAWMQKSIQCGHDGHEDARDDIWTVIYTLLGHSI